MRVRKKPIEVEAVRWNGSNRIEIYELFVRSAGCLGNQEIGFLSNGEVEVQTLEGAMRCKVGDWIIRGVHDELYPCDPDIFEKTYERV